MELSIDLETTGTNVDSQILSIGLAMFDIATGAIGNTLYLPIKIHKDQTVRATMGTIRFWVQQAVDNPAAIECLYDCEDQEAFDLYTSLLMASSFILNNKPDTVWANGTKFDLGMLEYQFDLHEIEIPWHFNADRCMRTLRQFAGFLDVESVGVSHNALSDAIWQAKYISAACKELFN